MKLFSSATSSKARLLSAAACALVAAGLLVVSGLASRPAAAQAQPKLDIRAVSTHPEAVSGGDVLVQLTLPAGVAAASVTVTVNGRDVTSAFRPGSEPNALLGLVSDLPLGPSRIEAGLKGQRPAAQLAIVNHPISGPTINSPAQTPYICETESFGLGPALDADCSVKTRVEYFYKSTMPPPAPARGGGGGRANPPAAAGNDAAPAPARGGRANAPAAAGNDAAPAAARGNANAAPNPDAPAAAGGGGNPYKPFDPANPHPADLAMTTTSDGRTVPYIVRREMGTINRSVYVIAFLHEPGTPLPDPWTMTPGWNRKLVYSFGPGCGAGYHQGRNIGGLNAGRNNLEDGQVADYAIAKGYALIGASLNAFGTTCADVISTETTIMLKEHFVEQFGVPKYTVGSGRSGGSMQQHMIANNYPGVLDGIQPTASFSDTMTFEAPLFDCELLEHAFATSTLSWTAEQKQAIEGPKSGEYCSRLGTAYPQLKAATNYDKMAIPEALVYNPMTNPKGARFTYQDNMVNVFGRDPKTGFARRPFDNVGIQYGLGIFNAGQISFEQFVDLNKRVGGHDIDGNVVAERTVADPDALRIAYQTGRINSTGAGMAMVPIIDVRPYADGNPDVHDSVNSYITRARLVAANGNANNQIIRTYAAGTPIARAQADNLDLMDKWLTAILADQKPAKTPLEKVVRNKPAEAMDACYSATLEKQDPARCKELFPYYSDPRLVAGAPLTADRVKCELKPIDKKDYKLPITDAQLASLKTVFPQGVCDYSKRGVGQVAPQTWLSYPRTGDGKNTQ